MNLLPFLYPSANYNTPSADYSRITLQLTFTMNFLSAALTFLPVLTLTSANKGFRKDEYVDYTPREHGKDQQKCHKSKCIYIPGTGM
jgi:hypothetical protein